MKKIFLLMILLALPLSAGQDEPYLTEKICKDAARYLEHLTAQQKKDYSAESLTERRKEILKYIVIVSTCHDQGKL